ncbi:uncharacterized protein N0V89_005366 [Didymosphaeria variabile]|uniref:Uncharacterized protein n=1 Tax=Didymosphaeria variabile TaxID=1932322 RepID=A0A9W8XL75_9PLEO|nr:uncharacterized protein N0V89_005366 [Didymosphaeria variabile]KAJ4353636.1 hypothetical protein N0V89_005366 [Didymosphaeria variabile]
MQAVTIKKRIRPANLKVGVELDRDLFNAGPEPYLAGAPQINAKAGNRVIFMAHWRVDAPLTDGQLVQIAMDGYMDMLEGIKPATYGNQIGTSKKALPGVITVFHWDNEIIIASSQSKGLPLTYTRNQHILELVQQCIQPNDAKSAQAKCGEMSAAQLFVHLYPNTVISTKAIVSVTVQGDEDNPTATTMETLTRNGIKAPCSHPAGNGCDRIIGPGKVIRREVPVGTAPAPYSKSGWTQSDAPQISFVLPSAQVEHA